MDNRKKFDVYRKTDVFTASRESILLMLYEAAIRFLKSAIEASEKQDLPEANRLITRVQEIVSELRATLNYEAGKEIAIRLETLYGFIARQLIAAASEKRVEPMKESLAILETLHSAWVEAIASLKKEKSTT